MLKESGETDNSKAVRKTALRRDQRSAVVYAASIQSCDVKHCKLEDMILEPVSEVEEEEFEAEFCSHSDVLDPEIGNLNMESSDVDVRQFAREPPRSPECNNNNAPSADDQNPRIGSDANLNVLGYRMKSEHLVTVEKSNSIRFDEFSNEAISFSSPASIDVIIGNRSSKLLTTNGNKIMGDTFLFDMNNLRNSLPKLIITTPQKLHDEMSGAFQSYAEREFDEVWNAKICAGADALEDADNGDPENLLEASCCSIDSIATVSSIESGPRVFYDPQLHSLPNHFAVIPNSPRKRCSAATVSHFSQVNVTSPAKTSAIRVTTAQGRTFLTDSVSSLSVASGNKSDRKRIEKQAFLSKLSASGNKLLRTKRIKKLEELVKADEQELVVDSQTDDPERKSDERALGKAITKLMFPSPSKSTTGVNLGYQHTGHEAHSEALCSRISHLYGRSHGKRLCESPAPSLTDTQSTQRHKRTCCRSTTPQFGSVLTSVALGLRHLPIPLTPKHPPGKSRSAGASLLRDHRLEVASPRSSPSLPEMIAKSSPGSRAKCLTGTPLSTKCSGIPSSTKPSCDILSNEKFPICQRATPRRLAKNSSLTCAVVAYHRNSLTLIEDHSLPAKCHHLNKTRAEVVSAKRSSSSESHSPAAKRFTSSSNSPASKRSPLTTNIDNIPAIDRKDMQMTPGNCQQQQIELEMLTMQHTLHNSCQLTKITTSKLRNCDSNLVSSPPFHRPASRVRWSQDLINQPVSEPTQRQVEAEEVRCITPKKSILVFRSSDNVCQYNNYSLQPTVGSKLEPCSPCIGDELELCNPRLGAKPATFTSSVGDEQKHFLTSDNRLQPGIISDPNL